MFHINASSNTPIFEQIVLEIGKYIALDIFKADDKLPSVRTLARDLGINPTTVAKAYSESEKIGMTFSIPGKGHFVSSKEKTLNNLIDPIYKDLDLIIQRLIKLGENKELIIEHIRKDILW